MKMYGRRDKASCTCLYVLIGLLVGIPPGGKCTSEADYVIELPNGEVRPVLFNHASRNWNQEKPLDRVQYAKGRIVGGRNAEKSEVPYQVGIMLRDQGIWCGGALYRRDIVLSAAHCFPNEHNDYLFVAGKSNMLVREPNEALSKAASITLHPGYSKEEGFNDLALIRLETPFCFNNFVQPIPIARPGLGPTGKGQISGWGYTHKKAADSDSNKDDHAKYSRDLRLTRINIIPRDDCARRFIESPEALKWAKHETAFCAGVPDGSEDACQGDSGGPLTCTDSGGKKYLCGIVSMGIGCGLPSIPAFYTDLSLPRLHQWILDTAGPPHPPCSR